MPYFKVGVENSGDINLYYEDHGSGPPVVLIHGFPLSGAAWEKQVPVLLEAGYRVITYDRRGFGKSSQPTVGYDYDTFAADLDRLMTKLDLRDARLVGHSMGTGEVTRYLSKYGSERVEKAVFISPIPPFLLKTSDNPDGVDKSIFDGFQKEIILDRPTFLTQFLLNFYNFEVYRGKGVSDQAFQLSWNVATGASAKGTHDCVATWMTDFRKDLPRIDVPVLIIHGTDDRILPFQFTAPRMHAAIQGSRLVPIEGGPHSLAWTHSEIINRELLDFLGEERLKKVA